MNLVHFTSRKGLESRTAEAEFIELCKSKLTLWNPLNWDALSWSPPGVSFTNLDQKSRVAKPTNALHPGISDFARAYLRYQQSHKPTMGCMELRAIRCVERALMLSGSVVDIHHISISILDEAASISRSRFEEGAAYQAGLQLEILARFLSERGLVEARLADWKCTNPRQNDRVRTGRNVATSKIEDGGR